MKIMFVVEQYADEGSRYYRDFFRHLRDLGASVSVVNLCRSGAFEADVGPVMDHYHALGLEGGYHRAVPTLRRLIAVERPSVIQGMETIPTFYAALATSLPPLGAPALVYGRRHGKTLGWVHRFMDQVAVTRSASVVAVSEATADIARSEHPLAGHKIRTILSGVGLGGPGQADADEVKRIAEARAPGSWTVLLLARLRRVKGHRVALRAVALLRDRGVGVRLLLVGDGPDRADLEAEVTRLDLDSRVHFVGHCEDVGAAFRLADLVVIPSLADALPKVAIEALAAGVPVVASAVEGLTDVFEPDVTGLLVPPEDAEALADAIRKVHDDPDLGRRLAERGRALYEERFTPESMVASYFELYRTLAED